MYSYATIKSIILFLLLHNAFNIVNSSRLTIVYGERFEMNFIFNPLNVELFFFCKTPVSTRLIFSMLLLGVELIFANLPPGAGLFFEPEKRRDPSRALMAVTK